MKKLELSYNSIIYFVSNILNSGISFFILPIIISYFSPEEYGILNIITLTSLLLGGFFCFGASSAYSRFYFEKKNKKELLVQVFKLSLFGGTFISIFGSLLSKEISNYFFNTDFYSIHIAISFISTTLGFFVNILLVNYQFSNKPIYFLKTTLTNVILNFISTIIFLEYFELGVLSPILGIFFSNSVISLYFLFKNFKDIIESFNKKIERLILFFGLNSAIQGLIYYLIEYSDRYLINEFLSIEDVGVYSLGYKLGLAVNVLLVIPFSYAWAPIRLKYNDDLNQLNFTSLILNLYFSITCLIIASTIFLSEFVFNFFFKKPEYFQSIKIIPIIMFALLIYGLTNISNIGLYVKNKIWIQNILLAISLFLNVLLNFLLIPIYGIKAAAYSTLLTFFVLTLFTTIISFKHIKIPIDNFKLYYSIFICICLIYINHLMLNINYFFKALILIYLIIQVYLDFIKIKKDNYEFS